MEIINLPKKCNKKARKVSQPKKALSKPDEPKKASSKSDEPKNQSPLMIKARKKRSIKKHQAMEKKTATKAEKKAPKSPEFSD